MPPRRRRAAVAKPAAAASRVHRIATFAQWENMLKKAGDRVVVAQFFQANLPICMQMRSYFVQLSKKAQFKKVIFAEVDLDESPELGEVAQVTRSPTYQCYWRGELKSSYAGGMPDKVNSMVEAAVAEFGGHGGSLVKRLLTALAVVGVAAAGVYAALRLGGGEGGGDEDAQMADVVRKLSVAYDRLRACERANRIKGALAQRKLIERLEARKRVLERSQEAKQQQGAGKRVGKAAAKATVAAGYHSEGEEEREGAAQQQEGEAGVEREDGRVAYSDEEEDEE